MVWVSWCREGMDYGGRLGLGRGGRGGGGGGGGGAGGMEGGFGAESFTAD